ncbi:unnamed protein product [Ilex paraguariensis]|uniref:Uncharacterized protein n=1 Tax=Ilex paraguariensis TaxID=185542 RepID=A0ABC8TXJ0_9AQUA
MRGEGGILGRLWITVLVSIAMLLVMNDCIAVSIGWQDSGGCFIQVAIGGTGSDYKRWKIREKKDGKRKEKLHLSWRRETGIRERREISGDINTKKRAKRDNRSMRERECQQRLDSSNLVRDGSMKYGAWLRAPLGGGLKNVVGLNASVNKLPTVEKSEISPASEQDSPKKIYQNEAAVIEQSFMGVTGPISGDGGISNSKNSVTIEDGKLKKVEDAMSVMEGISTAIIMDNNQKERNGVLERN